jgi:hypothetical protein
LDQRGSPRSSNMTNQDLLNAAKSTLNSELSASSPSVQLALSTLSSAFSDYELAIVGGQLVMFNRAVEAPSTTPALIAVDALGNMAPEPEILSRALSSMTDPTTSADLRGLMVTLLTGPSYAGSVTPEAIMAVGELSRSACAIWNVVTLVESAHSQRVRGLPAEFVASLRDSWSQSTNIDKREQSACLARLLPFNAPWAERMLADPSAEVRFSAVNALPELQGGHDDAIGLICFLLDEGEQHQRVIAAAHEALVELCPEADAQGARRRAKRRRF